MAVEYLWHDHPLRLISVPSSKDARCFVCSLPAGGYSYACLKRCSFFLHIPCLKLPLRSLHPLHPDHPLTLLGKNYSFSPQNLCNYCKSPWSSGFAYHCSPCSFTLHLPCASHHHSFNLPIHKHPLSFSPSPPSGFLSFDCHVCGESGFGFNLGCTVCNIHVHVECSAVPVNVTTTRHRHPFTLTSVRSVDDGSGEFYCDIVCEGEVNPKASVYYCAECNYMAHLGCLASAPKPLHELAYKEIKISSIDYVDHCPEPRTSHENQFDRQIQDEDLAKLRGSCKGESKTETELEHFSHPHALNLTDEHKNVKPMSCRGCWGELQSFSYGCKNCRFFLHPWCAKLPEKIHHPIHPSHKLTLLDTDEYDCCNACDEPCDGFTYNCKPCSFNLHAMCASIPITIRNEIHEHPLSLTRKRRYSVKCKACGGDCTGIVFECEICSLVLDFKCGLLPYKIKNICHLHSLILKFVPVPDDDHSDEFYCDACEKRRDPSHWVYHCSESCDFSAHMTCVVSELLGGRPSRRPYRGPLEFNHHEHLLRLIGLKIPFSSM
ncbi:hypothetical protein NMG60_11025531 [Bertholletia excelsa]